MYHGLKIDECKTHLVEKFTSEWNGLRIHAPKLPYWNRLKFWLFDSYVDCVFRSTDYLGASARMSPKNKICNSENNSFAEMMPVEIFSNNILKKKSSLYIIKSKWLNTDFLLNTYMEMNKDWFLIINSIKIFNLCAPVLSTLRRIEVKICFLI